MASIELRTPKNKPAYYKITAKYHTQWSDHTQIFPL